VPRKREAKTDADLLAEWAAEEFLAAGRSDPAKQDMHRQRARFLADVLSVLRRPRPDKSA
jgi:hypothetical protein